jgi:hypothetical protein
MALILRMAQERRYMSSSNPIEFISLQAVVDGIADSIEQLPDIELTNSFPDDRFCVLATEFWNKSSAEIDTERRFSAAARLLNKRLHNSGNALRFMEYDEEKKFPVVNELVVEEIIKRLTVATNYHANRRKSRMEHIDCCRANNWNPLDTPLGCYTEIFWDYGRFMRQFEIGFVRADLLKFLNINGIKHTLTDSEIFDQNQSQNLTEQPKKELTKPDDSAIKPFHREIDNWLYQLWIKNKPLGGAGLFQLLEDYVGQEGTPIKKYRKAGNQAGFDWESSSGATGTIGKGALQNMVSKKFKPVCDSSITAKAATIHSVLSTTNNSI